MKSHVKEIIVNNCVVELKSRTDERYPSGWSVIAFTPEHSIRSTKLHRDWARQMFADAIIGSCDLIGASPTVINKAKIQILDAIKEVTA